MRLKRVGKVTEIPPVSQFFHFSCIGIGICRPQFTISDETSQTDQAGEGEARVGGAHVVCRLVDQHWLDRGEGDENLVLITREEMPDGDVGLDDALEDRAALLGDTVDEVRRVELEDQAPHRRRLHRDKQPRGMRRGLGMNSQASGAEAESGRRSEAQPAATTQQVAVPDRFPQIVGARRRLCAPGRRSALPGSTAS